MADYAARRWQREFRSINPTFDALDPELQTAEIADDCRRESALCRNRASQIRAAVHQREFTLTFDLMATENCFGRPHVCVLERAIPLMIREERAFYLRYVWCRSKSGVSPSRALRLFRAVPSLRKTVPSNWGAEVRVYRGAWRHSTWTNPWQTARRRVRRGISWTTDRATAETFATGRLGDGFVGCLGTATVSRSAILAYFMNPNTVEIGGRPYPVDGFHEHECIIDPSVIEHITYERVAG